MTNHTPENYERDHSHSHCWEEASPPCGQKIEHLKCCLCELPNPKVSSVTIPNTTTGYLQMVSFEHKPNRELVQDFTSSTPKGDWEEELHQLLSREDAYLYGVSAGVPNPIKRTPIFEFVSQLLAKREAEAYHRGFQDGYDEGL